MTQAHKLPNPARTLVLAVSMLLFAGVALAQGSTKLVGTLTAVNGNSLTVKPDQGEATQVTVPDGTSIKRLEPGQKLTDAATITLTDLAVGDRVLMLLDASASSPQAKLIVAMKQSDVAQKQAHDREAWQQGVAGLVKKVDAATNTITVASGAGSAAHTVNVELKPSAVLLRYAPNSFRFEDAKPGPLSAIQPGDQFRARGAYNADRTQFAADEIVSGTFRNVAGLVTEIDTNANTILVKDLATKKPVTVHIEPATQMKRLPDRMAQMIAMRLKGTMPARAGEGNGRGSASGQPRPGGSAQGNGDLSRVLGFAPAIKLADLQKGEAVMVVATSGANNVSAITLLAGVAPLLEAPEATDLLSNWSMGGGGADAAAGPQ